MKDILDLIKKELILNILLFLVAFSLPFSYAFNSIASSAFNSISIAVLFLYSFVFFQRDIFLNSFKLKEVYLFYILFFILQIVSICYANNKVVAYKIVTRNILFLILPITFVNLKNRVDEDKLRILYFGLLLAVLANLTTSYFNAFRAYMLENMHMKTIVREKFIEFGIYDIHVPYLAMLVVFLIICTYKITFSKRKKINIVIKLSLIIFLTISLLQLSGIMSIFILGVFFVTQFLLSRISTKTKIFVSFLIGVSVIFSFFVLKNIEQSDHIRGSENIIYRAQKFIKLSDPVRVENWNSVVKVISSNLFLGVGADGGLELLQKERNVKSEPYINRHNAHNDILEILLRYGLVGLCMFLIIVLKLVKKAILTKEYFLGWFLIVFLISGLTESYLQRQIGLVFFVFLSLFLYNLKTINQTELKSS